MSRGLVVSPQSRHITVPFLNCHYLSLTYVTSKKCFRKWASLMCFVRFSKNKSNSQYWHRIKYFEHWREHDVQCSVNLVCFNSTVNLYYLQQNCAWNLLWSLWYPFSEFCFRQIYQLIDSFKQQILKSHRLRWICQGMIMKINVALNSDHTRVGQWVDKKKIWHSLEWRGRHMKM